MGILISQVKSSVFPRFMLDVLEEHSFFIISCAEKLFQLCCVCVMMKRKKEAKSSPEVANGKKREFTNPSFYYKKNVRTWVRWPGLFLCFSLSLSLSHTHTHTHTHTQKQHTQHTQQTHRHTHQILSISTSLF